MGAIGKLKGALGIETSDRVVMDGREYHGECAVARMDAGELPAEGETRLNG